MDTCIVMCVVLVFFKQKAAYEMRMSDWSSDVCSSDLLGVRLAGRHPGAREHCGYARGQGASLVGIVVAGLCARQRTDADGSVGPPPVQRPETGAATLLRWRSLWPAARRRGRASGRSQCSGLREERKSTRLTSNH